MYRKRIFSLIALCGLAGGNLLYAAGGDVLATVNGKAITKQQLETFKQTSIDPRQSKNISDRAIIEQLVSRELLYEEAIKEKVDKNPDVKKFIELQKRELIIQSLLRLKLSKLKINDDDVKKAYDEQIKKAHPKEYKARHILVKEEAEAKTIIAELDTGKDFAELAKQKSTGPSGKSGGDLGWFGPHSMVPAFAQAVTSMKKGSYSKQPVKTQFGWHVIKLEDSRDVKPPAFADVKEQLKGQIRNQAMQNFIKSLRDKAKIEIK